MTIKWTILSIICMLLFSCGDGKISSDAENESSEDQNNPITESAIEDFEYSDYALSTEAETRVANWEKYQELSIQIDYLKKADISFFNGDKELFKTFIEEFKAGLPKDLNINPIISRMIVIETAALRLHDNLTLDNIDGQDQLDSIKEVLVAFSNLNYQINKKLERDKFDKISSEY